MDVALKAIASPRGSGRGGVGVRERARKRSEVESRKAVYAYALGVTARLITSVSAVLDPHVSVEEQEHALAELAAKEAEGESAALIAWSRATEASGGEGEGSENGSGDAGDAETDAGADAEVLEGNWDAKINEACLRYKTGAAPLEAMDDLCGILKESRVSPQLASQTLHTRWEKEREREMAAGGRAGGRARGSL
jgi:hypothetical protein